MPAPGGEQGDDCSCWNSVGEVGEECRCWPTTRHRRSPHRVNAQRVQARCANAFRIYHHCTVILRCFSKASGASQSSTARSKSQSSTGGTRRSFAAIAVLPGDAALHSGKTTAPVSCSATIADASNNACFVAGVLNALEFHCMSAQSITVPAGSKRAGLLEPVGVTEIEPLVPKLNPVEQAYIYIYIHTLYI